jgi:hypothetical protein
LPISGEGISRGSFHRPTSRNTESSANSAIGTRYRSERIDPARPQAVAPTRSPAFAVARCAR